MLKVVCAIIIKEQKFLVTQLPDFCQRALEWEFPGGKVETGETAEVAIIREIKEELSIEIRIFRSMEPIFYFDGEKEIELIPFLCEIASGTIELTEHVALDWISLAQMAMINFSKADKVLIQHPENQKILKEYTGKNVHNTR